MYRGLSIRDGRRGYGMMLLMFPSRRPLRVLHTAGVHLDCDRHGSPGQAAVHRESGPRVFQRPSSLFADDRRPLSLSHIEMIDL
jgi:hypothetical protein